MHKNYILLCFFLLNILSFQSTQAQSTQAEATIFFSDYLVEKKLGEMLMKSLPTLSDIKQVFSDSIALIYYQRIQILDSMSKNSPQLDVDTTVYVDMRVDTFLSEDVYNHKGNYAGGMNSLVDFLLPNITFYKLEMLHEPGAPYGMAFNYFVNLHNQWLFFPKPWRIFRK